MNTTKTTYAEQWNRQAQKLKMEVCELLGWDEMAFAEFQYKMGMAYLMWYAPCDENKRRKLEANRLFWNWWKHAWYQHDESFLSFKMGLRKSSLYTRLTTYEELHCPRVLVNEITPNDVVLSDIKTKEVTCL